MVQLHIKENHQNGKDTHIRGIKIYALDDQSLGTARDPALGLRTDVDDGHARGLATQGVDEASLQGLLDAFERHPISMPNSGDAVREPVIR
jgi:anaphase-promoting complex subunit 10